MQEKLVTPVTPGQSGAIGFPSQLHLSLVGFKWKPSGKPLNYCGEWCNIFPRAPPPRKCPIDLRLYCAIKWDQMRSTLASRIEKRNSSTETSLEDLKHQLEILSAQQQSVPESESGTGGVGVRSISQEVRGTWCPQLYFRHLIQLRILKTFKT